MAIRILVADDHELLRSGIIAILNNEPGIQVIGEADNGEEAVRLTSSERPDIALLDINMPKLNGLQATCEIKKTAPEVKIIILTVFEDKYLMEEVIRSGAKGYIPKSAIKADLLNAIDSVLRGRLYIHPTMAEKLIYEDQDDVTGAENAREQLTQRELEVLKLIAQGNTNAQAAEILCLSPRTVEYHRSNIMSKLNLQGRVDLVNYAMQKKII